MASWLGGLNNLFTTSPKSLPCLNEDKMTKITVGPCGFRGLSGTLQKCSCTEGSCVISTSAIDWQISCCECYHPLSYHSSYKKEQIHHQGNDSLPAESIPAEISPRPDTVDTLAQMLEHYAVVHVRGTPATGKTRLARLLQDRLETNRRVVFMGLGWPPATGRRHPTEILADESHRMGFTNVGARDLLTKKNNDLIFIIDEAQTTYGESHLWFSVIKDRMGLSHGPSICLFSSYGSPSTGSPDYQASGNTPPILRAELRVSLVPSMCPGAPQISLFYNFAEFHDVVFRFSKNRNLEFKIEDNLKSHIYSMTNGHPGMVRSVLEFLETVYRNFFKRANAQSLGLDDVWTHFDDNDEFFGYLIKTVAGRSLPTRAMMGGEIHAGVVSVILGLLHNGYARFDPKNDVMVRAFRHGFIHTEALENGEILCILPSLLHARFVEFYYACTQVGPFPYDDYPTISELCLAILRHLCKQSLYEAAKSQRFGPSGRVHAPEAVFQDVFYQAFWQATQSRIAISSEWTEKGSGRIDFYVVSPGWGFELLRDGDRIEDHCARFGKRGIYHPWIQAHSLREWIILDCRHSKPKTAYPNQPNLWRVVFLEEYSRVLVLDCKNQHLAEFGLVNR